MATISSHPIAPGDYYRSDQWTLPTKHPFRRIIEDITRAERKREALPQDVTRHQGQERALDQHLAEEVEEVAGGAAVGSLLGAVVRSDMSLASKRYWSRILSDCAADREDVESLHDVLGAPELSGAHTAARKAIRRIDFRLGGPLLSELEGRASPCHPAPQDDGDRRSDV